MEKLATQLLRTVALFLLGTATQSINQAADGRVNVRIVDATGKETPARAWVDAQGQRLHRPLGPDTATIYAKDRSFSCDGQFSMIVPAGKVVVHVEKGKEFLPINLDLQVGDNQVVERMVELRRWIDMPSQGWFSADLHVHLGFDNPQTLKQLALADDVHLIPSFSYWLRGRGETWNSKWPDSTYTEPIIIDDRHVITRNNLEIERINRDAISGATIGATFLFNLQQPVTADRYGEHFPTDAELCRQARQQSPHAVFDCDKPAWAETVVGAALDGLDTVQVCHNHYHRLSSLAGGYGMIGPLRAGESNAAVGDGLFHRTNSLYYRLLNCGFRLAVSGGSAIGVMPVPTGYNRVYARLDGPLTPDSMWQAIRDGRSFATTGPMLTLTANERQVGSVIAIDSALESSIQLLASVDSIEALESLEIVHNGRIIASRDLITADANPKLHAELEFAMQPTRSGWVAARALYRAADGLLRQAHTSPIYISVDQKATAFADDARYMLDWLDRLIEIASTQLNRYPDETARQAVLSVYAEARAKYEAIAADAARVWGD